MEKHEIPDITEIAYELDITVLPREVAKRIEDMWRVGAILSRFVRDKQFRDKLYSGFRDIHSLCNKQKVLRSNDCDECVGLTDLIWSKLYPENNNCSDYNCDQVEKINERISITRTICSRLSCEVQLIFFKMALDTLPKKDKSQLQKLPLLDCLRRMRNIAVHYKNIGVERKSFEPNVGKIKLRFMPGAWFFLVCEKDMRQPKGPKFDPKTVDWFQRQCEKWPADFLLKAAVEQLCVHFSSGTSTF